MNNFKVTVTNADTKATKDVVIEQHIPTKGRGQGRPKLRPVNFDKLTAQDLIDIFGNSLVTKVITKPRFSQIISQYSGEALFKNEEDKDGNPIPETDEKVIIGDFSEMFQTLSFRGYTVTEIKERILEITGDTTSDSEGELYIALNAGDIARAMELKDELSKLRADLASLKRKPKAAPAPVAA